MRLIKIIGAICAFVGGIFIIYIYFAGVNLIVENNSGEGIHNIEIKYGIGIYAVDSIQHKEIIKKSIGKIGEGATFDVQWKERSGLNRQAQFNVYFYGHSGYDSVRILILPHGEIELYEGKRLYKPDTINNT